LSQEPNYTGVNYIDWRRATLRPKLNRFNRIPKGLRAPGLQDEKFEALGLHRFTQGFVQPESAFLVWLKVKKGFELRAP